MSIEILNKLNNEDIRKTAGTYAAVFAGPEWNEVSRCPIKDKFYGDNFPPGTNGPCEECNGVVLEEAYPINQTSEYILKEISGEGSTGYVFKENEKILGFGWGYILSGEDFAFKKYNEENREFIVSVIRPNINYFYVSEVGVQIELQGKGIGGQITRMIAQKGIDLGLPLLLRTSRTSTMAFTARNMGMELVLGGESLPPDPENNKRLLFVKYNGGNI